MRIEEELGSAAEYKGRKAFYNVKSVSAYEKAAPAKKAPAKKATKKTTKK